MAPMFPPRQERLDWQLIAELEPGVLVAASPEEIGNDDIIMVFLLVFCSVTAL